MVNEDVDIFLGGEYCWQLWVGLIILFNYFE